MVCHYFNSNESFQISDQIRVKQSENYKRIKWNRMCKTKSLAHKMAGNVPISSLILSMDFLSALFHLPPFNSWREIYIFWVHGGLRIADGETKWNEHYHIYGMEIMCARKLHFIFDPSSCDGCSYFLLYTQRSTTEQWNWKLPKISDFEIISNDR